jgi:hypothetical protein
VRRKPPSVATRPWQVSRQTFFTYNILTGRKSPFSSDIGSRQALPIVTCSSVANFISLIAL